MKKLLAVLLLSASAFAQTKESLEQRVSPKPSGTAGDIPYAVNTTTIGWIPHATGLQCLTQNGSATPVWGACSAGTSPLTTKGDLYTFSTLDVRLPVGTNGYVLEPDSTQATGLKWVDPNVSSTGWVKLQASYPGSQQTGSFNVSGAAGSGPYTAAYTTVSGSPGTYDLLRVFYDTAGVAGDRYRILFGSSGDTAKQLALSYYNPASGGGEQPSWTFHAVSLSEGNGVTLFKKGSLTQLCVDTDGTSASGYPTICNGGDAFNVGYVSGAGPALQINGTGDIVKIRNVVYAWPSSAAAAATCLRRDAVGNLSWDTACGTGTTGFSAQTANTVFAGPTSGGAATPAFRALVSADIPNNAADTTGKSATTDALNTTTTAVNVSLSAAPGGAGYACITTDATHCTWQTVAAGGTVSSIATTAPITGGTITTTGTIGITSFATTAPSPGAVPDATAAAANTFLKKDGTWSTPTGTGGVTVATKGDIQTYDTNPANLAVGTNGQAVMADSSTATGLVYNWPGIGTLRTLKETVFAGITPASYSSGSTTTIDGSGYTCTLVGNGTAAIVAAGLQLRQGTTSGTGNGALMQITDGAAGDFLSIVGEARFRRGQWGFWTRRASYDFTNASGTAYARSQVGSTTAWLVAMGREKNLNGTPNTATGGNTCDYAWNGSSANANCYPGVSTNDVMLSYYRTPEILDIYHGAWSGGWPTMESMTLIGTIQMQTTGFVGTGGAPVATPVDILFYVGGSAASSGTWELVIDRWRVTAWE